MSKRANQGSTRRQFVSGAAATLPMVGLVSCATPIPTASGETDMETVTGIGGFFFRADDPQALREWYKSHLGVDMAPQFSGGAPWQQDAGYTIFDPFPYKDPMIPAGKSWMINFRVNNLQKMIDQLRAAGVDVPDLEAYPHGKFTSFNDPEGNGIQLWEPASA